MITATIETVTDANGQYGPEKISAVTMADGGQTKVYTKPKASSIYNALRPGLQVELMPKNSGTGYLIKSIIGEAPASNPAPARQNGQAHGHRQPDKKAQAQYIEMKAGQLKYAYDCLTEKFGATLLSEETLRAFASTIIISLDREGPK